MQIIETQPLSDGPDLALPPIRVGETTIDPAEIALEMQYHTAGSPQAAQTEAARALVIRELLRQRAGQMSAHGRAGEMGEGRRGEEGRGEEEKDNEQVRISQLLEQELTIPEPDDDTCQRYFEANQSRFCTPPRYQVRHILLAAAPDDQKARDGQRVLGDELLSALTDTPERFDEFAQRFSACPSKEAGGALGELSPGQTVPELDDALRHLPEGLHERPLASRYGWHLVQIDRRLDGETLPLEQVIDRVRHTLREQSTRRALRHYLLALEAEIGVEGICLDEDAGGTLMQ